MKMAARRYLRGRRVNCPPFIVYQWDQVWWGFSDPGGAARVGGIIKLRLEAALRALSVVKKEKEMGREREKCKNFREK